MRTEYWIVIGILCYAAFMVFHGFSNFKQTSKSAESFFNADRGVNSFVLVCTCLAVTLRLYSNNGRSF